LHRTRQANGAHFGSASGFETIPAPANVTESLNAAEIEKLDGDRSIEGHQSDITPPATFVPEVCGVIVADKDLPALHPEDAVGAEETSSAETDLD
jgi:hypothetical protein